MTWLIPLVAVLLIGGLAVAWLARYLGQIAKVNLTDLLKAIEAERDIVAKQRAQLASDMFGANIVAKQMEATNKRVQNGIETVKALSARIGDPTWMRKFDEGRENAQWN